MRDVVSRNKIQQEELSRSLQQQQQENEHIRTETSKEMRSETERVKQELERLRHDFAKLVSNYEPANNQHQQQAQLHSQIDTMRQFYEQEFRQRQALLTKVTDENKPIVQQSNGHYRAPSPIKHEHHEYSSNGSHPCSVCSNSRLLRERLDNAIDTSLAEQRIQAIKQMPILPRQASPVPTTGNHGAGSSVDHLRKRYYL